MVVTNSQKSSRLAQKDQRITWKQKVGSAVVMQMPSHTVTRMSLQYRGPLQFDTNHSSQNNAKHGSGSIFSLIWRGSLRFDSCHPLNHPSVNKRFGWRILIAKDRTRVEGLPSSASSLLFGGRVWPWNCGEIQAQHGDLVVAQEDRHAEAAGRRIEEERSSTLILDCGGLWDVIDKDARDALMVVLIDKWVCWRSECCEFIQERSEICTIAGKCIRPTLVLVSLKPSERYCS